MSCPCTTPLNCATFGCLKTLRAAQRLPLTGPLPAMPEPPLLSADELEGLTRAAAWFPAAMALGDRAFAAEPDLDWEMYTAIHEDHRRLGATLSLALHPAEEIARRLVEDRRVLAPWGSGNAFDHDGTLFADPGVRRAYGGLVAQIAASLYRLLDFLATRTGLGAAIVSDLLRTALPHSGVPAHLVPALDQAPGRPAGEFLAIVHMHRSGLPRPTPDIALAAGLRSGAMLDPRLDRCVDGQPGLTKRYPIRRPDTPPPAAPHSPPPQTPDAA